MSASDFVAFDPWLTEGCYFREDHPVLRHAWPLVRETYRRRYRFSLVHQADVLAYCLERFAVAERWFHMLLETHDTSPVSLLKARFNYALSLSRYERYFEAYAELSRILENRQVQGNSMRVVLTH